MNPPLVIFVAMPGTDMGPQATWRNTAEIKQYLYAPVADQVKAELKREVELRIEKDKIGQGVIHQSMFNEASEAPVYIADLTGANPNFYFELGVRWTLRNRVTVLVCQDEKVTSSLMFRPVDISLTAQSPRNLSWLARGSLARSWKASMAGSMASPTVWSGTISIKTNSIWRTPEFIQKRRGDMHPVVDC